MNENKLYTLKEIAAELGVNYKTLLSCKDRFQDFVFGVPYGRVAKYSGDFVDFFKLLFALFDEGYSTLKIRTLLLNGVEEDDDSFIESWLESWRAKLYIPGVKDKGHCLKQDDGLTDRPTDGLTDGPTDLLTDGPTDWRTDGLTGGLTDGLTDWMTDGLPDGPTDGLTDLQDDGMTQYVVYANAEDADGPQKIHPDLTPYQNINFTEHFRAFEENLSRVLSETLASIFQRMATENNIAITAICETIEDIQRGIQTLDARLSALEEELGTETDDPIDMYQIEAGELQVSLPEPVFDFRLPPEQPIEETQPDPHGLTTIRESIENGRPDRDTVMQWVLSQRETQPPPSYKKLAAILNDAKIPTLSGRDAWSRSTLRNLAVRAEET